MELHEKLEISTIGALNRFNLTILPGGFCVHQGEHDAE
jgi:hypothetical protein